ncbi:16S rRNA (uracil(1498)-N(3))-methyltransferase [Oscillospiraceae bacterium 42-9]
MPRFFVDAPPQGSYFLDGEAGRHGAKVLRLRPGEAVTLCDGQGTDWPCQVEENTGVGLLLQVGPPQPNQSEPPVQVTVCQCLPKGDKLETVVQKAVELGAAAVWPLESARCVARWDKKSTEKKLARLQKIALEAAMQSGRGIVPLVLPPASLQEALETAAREGQALFFYEKARDGLTAALVEGSGRLFLFVGPEGGFAGEEAALAQDLGAKLLTLGPRILRTETAPLAALAAVMYARGGMEL